MTKKICNVDKSKLLEETKNYMLIEFAYKKIVVPYNIGMTLMEALQHAEYAEGGYSTEDIKIMPMPTDVIDFKLLSEQQYLAGKMSHILGVPVNMDTFNIDVIYEEVEDES